MSYLYEGQLIAKGGQVLRKKYPDNDKEFFDSEYPGLYRYALYLTRDPETAQDLCQETFIRWFNLANASEIERADAWLKKVLSNLAYNYFRHQKVRSRWEIDCEDERLEGRVSMEADITRLEVEDVLSTLAWKDQMLIKMRLVDMSYKEMAETLNVSVGSVGTMLSRAMQKFKEAYTGKELDARNELSGPRQITTVSGRRIKS